MAEKKKSILIVDDDSRNIFALSLVLRSRGYEVLTAGDARTGIEMIVADTGIGMMLLDMMMPDMDGYQALQQIRSEEKLKTFPVVAVTAQAMQGDREKCLSAGATEYIAKPIDMDLLTGILNRYLSPGT
ncbi:response regulator [Taibaiella koreensis]|uniref:response regulator n=1 Tax=Taibaiella koreensis TaxID=1268548 RepID=UPI000E59AC31|nr:response regulator [Taibaiella koreensis]